MFDSNNIAIGDETYESTPGLWELTVKKTPTDEIYTVGDMEKCIDILTGY